MGGVERMYAWRELKGVIQSGNTWKLGTWVGGRVEEKGIMVGVMALDGEFDAGKGLLVFH